MLVIRLQRTGNRNNPTYRLVAAEKRNSAKKNPLEILGHYLPTRDPAEFDFKQDRVEFHINNGARPSDTVARLLKKAGMKDMEKFMERYSKKKKRNAPDEPVEAPAPAAPEAPAEEKPAEEAPKEEEKPAEEPKEAPAEETSSEDEGDKKESDQ